MRLRVTPFAPLVFALVALTAQAACSNVFPDAGERPSAGPSEVEIAPLPRPSPPAAMPEPSPPPPRARRLPDFEDLEEELARRCPVGEGLSNVDQKERKEASLGCLRRAMNAELDAILLPLERRDPEAFSASMREQATWNRGTRAACRLEEERFWIDWTTGRRDDGTMRGYAHMSCLERAYVERIFYARALRAGDARALAARIEGLGEDGEAVMRAVAEARAAARTFAESPPAPADAPVDADWSAIAADAAAVQEAARKLARSTCAGWEALARALGGKEACEEAAERYYYLQGGSPDAGVR